MSKNLQVSKKYIIYYLLISIDSLKYKRPTLQNKT